MSNNDAEHKKIAVVMHLDTYVWIKKKAEGRRGIGFGRIAGQMLDKMVQREREEANKTYEIAPIK